MPDPPAVLSIGELSAATGVAVGTLRMWEARHGFPEATRQGGGHRRYDPEDAARVARVLQERERGLSLPAAIERVRGWSPSAPPSLFATLREAQLELEPHRLSVPAMLAVSHAIEDECLARAARPILVGSFEHEHAYRRAEHRWRELSRTAAAAFVLADFPRRRVLRHGPAEIPIDRRSPLGREWAIVCVDQRYTVCLAGWEQPGDDCPRSFEALWSTEPAAVTAVMRAALSLAEPAAASLAARASETLERVRMPAGDGAATLALANRMVAYLAERYAPAARQQRPPPPR